jgi:hypothetical protein
MSEAVVPKSDRAVRRSGDGDGKGPVAEEPEQTGQEKGEQHRPANALHTPLVTLKAEVLPDFEPTDAHPLARLDVVGHGATVSRRPSAPP